MRELRVSSFFLAICIIFTIPGKAQHMNAADAPCQSAGSGADTTRCFFDAYKKADEDLNRVYSKLPKVLAPEEIEKMRVAQRLWVQFRDANCAAEKDLYAGGSAAYMVWAACMEADTRQRTVELKTMYGWRFIKSGIEP
jgi:uncharacterized protein YecT (DUF1311 family)